MNRRDFLERASALLAAGLSWTRLRSAEAAPWFRISLAEWSLHRTIFGGKLDALDFPVVARRTFGIEAVEYVNQFFFDRARDRAYLGELKRRAEGEGVRSLLIMCDREGRLGDPDPARRRQAVENHYKWVEAARFLGCHSIRVNAASEGSYEEQQKLAADGLRQLVDFAAEHELNVLVENHGGLSSNGAWLAGVIRMVDHPRCGTLPDFGNWRVDAETWYDPYRGLAELMPFAKGVSAKSYDFDAEGNETRLDYVRLLRIVREAGYRGYIGIEYEGDRLDEMEGIRATKALLERVRAQLAEAQNDQGGQR
ncbi:sugar phosphate isomerase/epimerase family protein [Rhodothermus marinus]|uniref:Xylose isomerase domain protein TIM barrel n=1 Tax=Rhodothermus marinus (strain ATCC 43812 / DSM 4252 / R-10) TaxID=518766 RepID=D0MJG9_RHOM4|nr:sugar phosphate isomerase/epimerase family protein [Rhodothermus marinus]ACY48627.1 Xylose isomerase domain protein TIM barrel [Rhodothermus marinus DSM 4252]